MQTKQSLRRVIKSHLAAQSAKERAAKSLKIQVKLFSLPAFQKAGCVLFYAALRTEVDTFPMIDRALKLGKKVLLPLTDLENKELSLFEIRDPKKELRPGVLGIPEPSSAHARQAAADEIDCVVVPGLAFDKAGHRLGRGAGLYDRFLARLSPQIPKIGLAFSFQVLPEIPYEKHDHKLDSILTE